MKIAINKCYGGFSISEQAFKVLLAIKAEKADNLTPEELRELEEMSEYSPASRNDPDLIKVIEELGEEANGDLAEIKIIEIPDDVAWVINDYDGVEWVAEVHRTWR